MCRGGWGGGGSRDAVAVAAAAAATAGGQRNKNANISFGLQKGGTWLNLGQMEGQQQKSLIG